MISVREAIRDAIAEEMRRDDSVFLLGEEVAEYNGAYKVSQGLLNEFGARRVIDTPITEYGFAGIGVGAAFAGLRPIVEFMTFNFAMQAIDHIVNSAAKTRYMSDGDISCPIVFRGPNGAPGGVAAQHSQCFASWYAHVPGLKVVAPYTSTEAKLLLKEAIKDNNPVVFLEHETLYGRQFKMDEMADIKIGKASVVRDGTDVTITAFSVAVDYALQASEILSQDYGIEAEVINLLSLRPIDVSTIAQSVKKTNRIVNIEEGWLSYGVGAEVCKIACDKAFDYLDAPPICIGAADVPTPYAHVLENSALPTCNRIVTTIKNLFGR